MKMRAPENCCGLVHDGRFLAIGEDGCIDVDAAEADALACHGFTLQADVEPVADTPDIEAMNRGALFTYLREQGVTVTLPITNDALRAAARAAADG